MYKMRCIRQINKHFNFLPSHRNFNFGILGVCLTKKLHYIDEHRLLHYTTLNIHIIPMECIRDFKFGMMIHHYRFNSFVNSMTPYDLDRNLQGH